MEDKELVAVERKISGERTRVAFMMRKQDARTFAALTDAMQDAWVEIARAYALEFGFMGYPSDYDYASVRAGMPKDVDFHTWAHGQIQTMKDWCALFTDKVGEPKSRTRGIVVDIVYRGDSVADVAFQRSVHRHTVLNQLREGLNLYCVMRGWGDQLNKEKMG